GVERTAPFCAELNQPMDFEAIFIAWERGVEIAVCRETDFHDEGVMSGLALVAERRDIHSAHPIEARDCRRLFRPHGCPQHLQHRRAKREECESTAKLSWKTRTRARRREGERVSRS